jgi:hypothetical protein
MIFTLIIKTFNSEGDEVDIATVKSFSIPRKDEILWLGDPSWMPRSQSLKVTEVCYWVRPESEPTPSVCIYVEVI